MIPIVVNFRPSRPCTTIFESYVKTQVIKMASRNTQDRGIGFITARCRVAISSGNP